MIRSLAKLLSCFIPGSERRKIFRAKLEFALCKHLFRKDVSADVVIPLGKECRAAYYATQAGLRRFASPLDWITSPSLYEVWKLYENNFEHFFDNCSGDTCEQPTGLPHRDITDTPTGMFAPHIFSGLIPFSEARRKALEIICRRWKRQDEIMRKAQRILFLTYRDNPIEEIESFARKMHAKYGNTIIMVVARNSPEKWRLKRRKLDGIEILEYFFKDVHPGGDDKNTNPDFWQGDKRGWTKLTRKISLSGKIFDSSSIAKTIKADMRTDGRAS